MKDILYVIQVIMTILLLCGCNNSNSNQQLYVEQPKSSVSGFVKDTDNKALKGIKIDMLYQDDTDITNISEEDIKRLLTELMPVFVEPQQNDLFTNEGGYYCTSGLVGLYHKNKTKDPIFVIATDSSNVYCSAIVATDIIYDIESGIGKGIADFILEIKLQ